jgi:hypothetical protein
MNWVTPKAAARCEFFSKHRTQFEKLAFEASLLKKLILSSILRCDS